MKRMRRVIVLAFFVAVLMSCLLVQASAAEVIDSGYCGGEGDGTNLRWTLTEDNVLTITGSGKMADYTLSNRPWDRHVRAVSVSNGVTYLGNYAFAGCRMTDITVPGSVVSIGDGIFNGCDDLVSVVLSDSITAIGKYTFYGCDKLTSVNIPKKLTVIGKQMFADCSKLKTIEIPEGVTTIESAAFSGCTALKSVHIPDKVTVIGTSAFSGCSSLAEIAIPDSVTTIDQNAFNGCSGLIEATIPGSVKTVAFAAFKNCTGLQKVVVFEGVKYIESDAFENCTTLTEVSLPNSLYSIEINAFLGCKSLREIVIPAGVKKINGSAFEDCTNLTAVFFEGNAPFEIGWQDGFESFDKATVTFYYIPGMTGWTNTDEYDAEAGTWNGYRLAVWEGHGEEEEPEDETAKIVALFPENKSSDFGTVFEESGKLRTGELSVAFNKDIKIKNGADADLDFTKGTIAIYRMDDDKLIWDGSKTGEDSVELCVDHTGKKLIIRPKNPLGFLDVDSVYYVVVDAGVVQFSDGSTHDAIKKGDWSFRTAKFIEVKPCALAELTDIDYLAFSSLVYKTLNEGETVKEALRSVWDKEWEDTDIKYRELYDHIQGWKVQEIGRNIENGFYAAAFVNEDDEAVIAYRGSIPFDKWGSDWKDTWEDWVMNDLPMMFLNTETSKSQYADAMAFYETVARGRTKAQIATTGHSLGGGWADIISAYSGCKGCTFNAINLLDLFYSAHPVEMAENFKGINRWNFYDHVNENDYFAGRMERAMKPHYLHESLFGEETLFKNHGLNSMIYKQNGQLCLTYAESYEPAAKEWLSINVPETTIDLVKLCYERTWDNLEDALSLEGVYLDMGTNLNNQLMGFYSSNTPWEHLLDVLVARVVYGGDGDDWVIGFVHSDVLVGGAGNDILDGRSGNDVYIYYKGQGLDTFIDIAGKDRICLYGLERSDVIDVRTDETDSTFLLVCCNGEPIIKINRNIRNTNDEGECDPIFIEINKENLCRRVDITEYLIPGVSYRDPVIIGCPVDIEIVDADGKVVYTVKDAEPGAFYTEYGNFYVYEEENGEFGKHLDLVEGYDLRIVGVGTGTMDVMVYETEQNTTQLAKGVAVTAATVATLEENNGNWQLSVDEDGDGEVDKEIPMGTDGGGNSRPSGGYSDLWLPAVTEAEPFRDVAPSDWFYDEVVFAYENGLMKGVNRREFAPQLPVTRAMAVTVLHRLDGGVPTAPCAFADVDSTAWYAEAVAWAAENGIVKGYGDGVFAPDDIVTREQLAAILYRYAQYAGEAPAAAQVPAFADGDQVSGWAKNAVGWACEEGLLNGMGDRRLEPKGQTTRAQLAAILLRLCGR